jgi:hypothetical protein
VPDYIPTTWTNLSGQPINDANLNHLEAGIDSVEEYVRQGPAKRVRAATTANLTLSAPQTIDGVSVTAGQRVLVKNQATALQNGIYVVGVGAWSRADDADDGTEFAAGTIISVSEGTVNGGKVFRVSNTGAITINTTALTFDLIGGTATTPYTTDGATPLKYSAFLSAASGNHNVAFQNAINAIYGNTGTYSNHLDLEGATVQLTSPVEAPTTGGSAGTISIINGEITAESGFTGGDHMIEIMGNAPSHFLRLVNVLMNGKTNASWIKWDIGNLVIEACQFKNPKPGTDASTAYDRAGLYCSDGGVGGNADAGFWINNCWFATEDNAVEPTSRWTVGILSQTGDNKIGGGTTMSYFRHSAIFEAPGVVIHGFHPFQGKTPAGTDMTTHTASLKFTNGRAGAQVSGLYLGKSFLEISNESNTSQREIGEIAITNMRAFMQNAESGAAHIVVRDFSSGGLSGDGASTVTDITITNSKFINGGATQTTPTKLHNTSAFNRTGYKGITMQGNTFESTGWDGTSATTQDVKAQSNPVTLRKTFSAATAHVIDFGGYMPFSGRPRNVLSVQGDRNATGTVGAGFDTGAISGDTVDFVSAASWAGDITATITVNNTFDSGFLNG